ncbi:MAG: translation initiation factor IF-2 [Candidatus Rokubacteria bacterium]|nr:translation initiation factor IF-2 [Candidatus Rokubacteria bacterium]
MIELAKELGVTSKDLMLAAEEMGHKGLRAMSPLDSTLANSLRVKLGKGRELPEEPKPKRAAKPKAPKDAAAPGEGAAARKPATRAKKPTKAEEAEAAPAEIKPAATIVKPKPATPEIAPEPPLVVPPPAPEVPVPEVAPELPATVRPAATVAPPPAPVTKKPEPKIVPFRPLERPAPAPAPRPSRPPAPPFAPPRVTVAPARPAPPPGPPRPAAPVAPPRPAAAAQAAPAAAATAVEAPPPPALLDLGVMATVNEMLDPTAAKLVADKFSFDVEVRSVEGDVVDEEDLDPTQLQLRPPVVTVMGHVDHGKTSLLDAIRKSKVAEKEFGGITQHIGAYQVVTKHGKVTFLDTPGHEAFTAMRARGAQATDIVILVVAADDGVMPQTVEAINHARAANVPIVVAVNKIDKPEADAERVKRELANHALVPEEWGGQTIYVPTSAKKLTGIDQLLEMTALQSEILELKANPNRSAKGVIIESRLDRGRGPVATVLIQTGTLKEGDAVVVGAHSGRIRALLDASGKKVKAAGPSDPVEIQGLSGVPSAGDVLVAVSDERKARQIATMRQDRERAKGKASTRITLEGLQKQIQSGEVKELRLILKADVQGSVEALVEALERLSTEEVKLKVIHSSVGAINESDVMLASASNAIVLGFNVKAEPKASTQAQASGVDLRSYNVIYEAINDLRAALAGLLAPEIRETALGRAQVRQIFVISKLGPICGSYVVEGKIVRGARARVRRGTEVAGEGTVGSLKRFKDDVREVLAGLECGIGVDGVSGVQPGDVIEVFTSEEVARTL